MKEFKQTESANLSVRDFRNMWLETEADPPAFIKARKEQEGTNKRIVKKRKRKTAGAESEEGTDASEDEEEGEPCEGETSRRTKKKSKLGSANDNDREEEDSDENHDDEYEGAESDSGSVKRRPIVIAANSPANVSVMSHDDLTVSTAPTPPTSGFLRAPSEFDASTISETDDTQATLVNKEDTQSTLVNPALEKEAETLGKEMEEWMHDTSFIKESEAFGKKTLLE